MKLPSHHYVSYDLEIKRTRDQFVFWHYLMYGFLRKILYWPSSENKAGFYLQT